jgi:hypothetical protein
VTREEIEKLAADFTSRTYGDDCFWDEVDTQGFAAAIEAALRAKWFSEPSFWIDPENLRLALNQKEGALRYLTRRPVEGDVPLFTAPPETP